MLVDELRRSCPVDATTQRDSMPFQHTWSIDESIHASERPLNPAPFFVLVVGVP
jgi:hypothetical protein